jgi:hypothetical protein
MKIFCHTTYGEWTFSMCSFPTAIFNSPSAQSGFKIEKLRPVSFILVTLRLSDTVSWLTDGYPQKWTNHSTIPLNSSFGPKKPDLKICCHSSTHYQYDKSKPWDSLTPKLLVPSLFVLSARYKFFHKWFVNQLFRNLFVIFGSLQH